MNGVACQADSVGGFLGKLNCYGVEIDFPSRPTNTEAGQSVAPRHLRMAPGTRSHSRLVRVFSDGAISGCGSPNVRLSMIDNPCHPCYSCRMPINVNLTPELEGLIRQKVSSGRYNSASEVVREALRLMEAEDQLRAAKLQQLRHDIQEGLHSGPARPWSVSEMKREGRKRLKASAASSRK